MNRVRALELLAQNKQMLARRFGVTRLALFGSMARDAARCRVTRSVWFGERVARKGQTSSTSTTPCMALIAPRIWGVTG